MFRVCSMFSCNEIKMQFTSIVMELVCVLLLVDGNAGTLVLVPADCVMTFQTTRRS